MTLRSRLLAVLLVACAATAASAQVFQTTITIALPPVLPRLVVVQPGVQVVEDLDEEVFFANGWYWVRRGDYWYRARDYRRTWVYAEPRFVPPGLRRIPPGQYRRYRKAEWKQMKRDEKAWRHERHEQDKEWRHERHEQDKERQQADKQMDKDWKKGHKGRHGRDD